MENLYINLIRDLKVLRAADPDFELSVSNSHKYVLNPPVTETEIRQLESKHRIRLPNEYLQFLLQVGNGGAGPSYGVFKLGEVDDGWGHCEWHKLDGCIGDLSSPFPYTEPWNDTEPCDDLAISDVYERQDRYWSTIHINGAIPVCHLGCSLRQYLIVTGPERGNIWYDNRADWCGLYPLTTEDRSRTSFFDWYRSWLDEELSKVAH